MKEVAHQFVKEIPESWEIMRLKHVVSAKITDGPHETPDLVEEGIPFVSAEAIKLDRIDFSRVRGYISEDVHRKYCQKCKPQKGDVFLVKSGATTGNAAMVETDEEFSIWSPLALIRVNKKLLLPRMLYYILLSDYFKKTIEVSWSFGTQQNIGMDVIENLSIIIPPESKQIQIARYLDVQTSKIREVIDRNEKLVDLLKEKRAAIINQAVTKGLDPKAKLKDSELEWIGKVPESWEVKKLKFLVTKIGSGITPTGGSLVYQEHGIPLVRSHNVHFDGLKLDDVAYISEEVYITMINSATKKHDVLLNITGASIGRCSIIEEEFEKGNVNQHVCIIRSKPDVLFYRYLNYFLMSNMGQEQIFSVQMGTSREGLNFEQIGDFRIVLPSVAEQIQIAEFLDSQTSRIDKIIGKIKKRIEFIEEYKISLINHVVTGKTDMRDQNGLGSKVFS